MEIMEPVLLANCNSSLPDFSKFFGSPEFPFHPSPVRNLLGVMPTLSASVSNRIRRLLDLSFHAETNEIHEFPSGEIYRVVRVWIKN